MLNTDLPSLISASSLLAGSSKVAGTPADVRSLLINRLEQYDQHTGKPNRHREGALEEIQFETALESLAAISQVQTLLLDESNAIGSTDLSVLRTLLSIIVNWGIEPFLRRVVAAIPTPAVGQRQAKTSSRIIDLTTAPEDFKSLSSIVRSLLQVLLPQGSRGPLAVTHITTTVIDRHLADVLRPALILGWLPKSLATESVFPLDDVRQITGHLLSRLPVSQSVSALSIILSGGPPPTYVRKASGFLLSRQILRQDGIRGMFVALFNEEEYNDDSAPLEKLENVAKVLLTVPAGMNQSDYYRNVVSQLLDFLYNEKASAPAVHVRAASFSLSSMLSSNNGESTKSIAARLVMSSLQQPFLLPTELSGGVSEELQNDKPSPVVALHRLQTMLTNTDPSPTLLSNLITPIFPSLFALLLRLERQKASDPALRTTVQGLLATWGRLVGSAEGVGTLWLVINGEGGDWEVDIAGELKRMESNDDALDLALFTPETLRQSEDDGELDVDANLFNLRPDPVLFVGYLKSIRRPDISSDLFVQLLNIYQDSRGASDSDNMRVLLYLQLIVQMQTQLSEEGSMDILKNPGHVLSFVKHALESATATPVQLPPKTETRLPRGLGLEDLRIVEVDDDEIQEGDSDDEDANTENGDEEMTKTAINLLLSTLAANTQLPASTTHILNDISQLLESLTKTASKTIQSHAREARMIVTARLASSIGQYSNTTTTRTGEEVAQETYQKALKLLQDPLLPVRAHGLLLLRQLVSSKPTKSGKLGKPDLDEALIPAISSIFLQALQDDDSYIFLNAVQGLSAMVDGFGKDVLKKLVGVYTVGTDGIAGTVLTQQDVDAKTRIGEALGQVIRRCGEALPAYVDTLVPPLFHTVRASHLPTILRTSALSLLAQCATTSTLALIPYTSDLMQAMVDLLQVETVASQPQTATPKASSKNEDPPTASTSQVQSEATSSPPTTSNSKFPPLRRAAIHFLTLLVKAYTTQISDGISTEFSLSLGDPIKRANTTLRYISAVDEDTVVRVMANEAVEAIAELTEVMTSV